MRIRLPTTPLAHPGWMIDLLLEGLPYAKMIETARHAIIVASDLSVAHGGLETDYWAQDCAAAISLCSAAQLAGVS